MGKRNVAIAFVTTVAASFNLAYSAQCSISESHGTFGDEVFAEVIHVAGPSTMNVEDHRYKKSLMIRRAAFMFADWFNTNRSGIMLQGKRYGLRISLLGDQFSKDATVNATRYCADPNGFNATFLFGPYGSPMSNFSAQEANRLGKLIMLAAASRSYVYETADSSLTFGTLPKAAEALQNRYIGAAYAIMEAASRIDAGAVSDDSATASRCSAPNCRSSLRVGVVRDSNICKQAAAALDSIGLRSRYPNGTLVDIPVVDTESNPVASTNLVRRILVNFLHAGVNILLICQGTGTMNLQKLLLSQLEALDFSPFAVLLRGSIATELLVDRGRLADYLLTSTAWNVKAQGRGDFSNMTSLEFATAFEARFGEAVDYLGASTFAALCSLMHSIERAGTLDTAAVSAQLRALYLSEFYGDIRFDENSQNNRSFFTTQLQPLNGSMISAEEIVWPLGKQSAALIFPAPTWGYRRCIRFESVCSRAHATCSPAGLCLCDIGWTGGSCNEKESQESAEWVWVFMYIVFGIVGMVISGGCATCGLRARRAWTHARQAEIEKKAAIQERLEKCVNMMTTLYHPVVFIRFSDFLELGTFVDHETAMAGGYLHFCHTYEELQVFVEKYATVFCSHQWLGFGTPDPSGIHFKTVCNACESLLARDKLTVDELYVWIDYSSIPQACKYTQTLSISSLAVYASQLRYFIIVAPETIHSDTGNVCNHESYSRRGWCRLEQWARLASAGTVDMFVWVDAELQLAFDDSLMRTVSSKGKAQSTAIIESLKVCSGDFSVPDDVYRLVDTILGLWAKCVACQSENSSVAQVCQYVRENYELVFPSTIFGDLVDHMDNFLRERDDICDGLRNNQLKLSINTDKGRRFRKSEGTPSLVKAWRYKELQSQYQELQSQNKELQLQCQAKDRQLQLFASSDMRLSL